MDDLKLYAKSEQQANALVELRMCLAPTLTWSLG